MKRETYALIFGAIFISVIVMSTNNALGDYRIEAALIEARSFYVPPKVHNAKPVVPDVQQTMTLSTTFGANTKDVNPNDVLTLQQFLVAKGYLNQKYVTGEFGPLTQEAVRNFQKANGIAPATGFVGELTIQKINEMSAANY
jgi:peptidoglycan hydrolase-like protein with peptidoglycan-binding domain